MKIFLTDFVYEMWTNPQWSFGWPPHYI